MDANHRQKLEIKYDLGFQQQYFECYSFTQ